MTDFLEYAQKCQLCVSLLYISRKWLAQIFADDILVLSGRYQYIWGWGRACWVGLKGLEGCLFLVLHRTTNGSCSGQCTTFPHHRQALPGLSLLEQVTKLQSEPSEVLFSIHLSWASHRRLCDLRSVQDLTTGKMGYWKSRRVPFVQSFLLKEGY